MRSAYVNCCGTRKHVQCERTYNMRRLALYLFVCATVAWMASILTVTEISTSALKIALRQGQLRVIWADDGPPPFPQSYFRLAHKPRVYFWPPVHEQNGPFHVLVIPGWVPLAVTVPLIVPMVFCRDRLANQCARCGYDVHACTDGRCSECGERI